MLKQGPDQAAPRPISVHHPYRFCFRTSLSHGCSRPGESCRIALTLLFSALNLCLSQQGFKPLCTGSVYCAPG